MIELCLKVFSNIKVNYNLLKVTKRTNVCNKPIYNNLYTLPVIEPIEIMTNNNAHNMLI